MGGSQRVMMVLGGLVAGAVTIVMAAAGGWESYPLMVLPISGSSFVGCCLLWYSAFTRTTGRHSTDYVNSDRVG